MHAHLQCRKPRINLRKTSVWLISIGRIIGIDDRFGLWRKTFIVCDIFYTNLFIIIFYCFVWLFRSFPFVRFANPEISHLKITAEYSHKYIKVELNWIILFPCAVEFLSHFIFVGCPQMCMCMCMSECACNFPGGKCRLCSSGCHWFIGLNALILCPEERREQKEGDEGRA